MCAFWRLPFAFRWASEHNGPFHMVRERETERVYRQLIEVIRFSENAFRGAEAILWVCVFCVFCVLPATADTIHHYRNCLSGADNFHLSNSPLNATIDIQLDEPKCTPRHSIFVCADCRRLSSGLRLRIKSTGKFSFFFRVVYAFSFRLRTKNERLSTSSVLPFFHFPSCIAQKVAVLAFDTPKHTTIHHAWKGNRTSKCSIWKIIELTVLCAAWVWTIAPNIFYYNSNSITIAVVALIYTAAKRKSLTNKTKKYIQIH